MAQSLHTVPSRSNTTGVEELRGHTVETDHFTAGYSPSSHEALKQCVPELFIVHLHSVYSDAIGHETTHQDKFKTHKKDSCYINHANLQESTSDCKILSRTNFNSANFSAIEHFLS